MDDRIMIVGPFGTARDPWLTELVGLDWELYDALTERHDLFARDKQWSTGEASIAAGAIWPSLIGRRTFIVGRRVATAFGIRWAECRWANIDAHGTQVALVPASLDDWYRDVANRSLARRFLRDAFRVEP